MNGPIESVSKPGTRLVAGKKKFLLESISTGTKYLLCSAHGKAAAYLPSSKKATQALQQNSKQQQD